MADMRARDLPPPDPQKMADLAVLCRDEPASAAYVNGFLDGLERAVVELNRGRDRGGIRNYVNRARDLLAMAGAADPKARRG